VISLICQLVMEGKRLRNVAVIGVGFHAVAAATLNDRVDNRTAFSRVGVSEKEPVLAVMESFP
jgi:hypothetical protein